MYSQLSMVGEPTTNDYKPLGTHMTLDLNSIIDELKFDGRRPNERRELRNLSSSNTRYKAIA
jgi:hypothetical protein